MLDTGFTASNHPQIQDVIVGDGAAWAICRVQGPTPNVAADLNPKQGVLQRRVGYFWWVCHIIWMMNSSSYVYMTVSPFFSPSSELTAWKAEKHQLTITREKGIFRENHQQDW